MIETLVCVAVLGCVATFAVKSVRNFCAVDKAKIAEGWDEIVADMERASLASLYTPIKVARPVPDLRIETLYRRVDPFGVDLDVSDPIHTAETIPQLEVVTLTSLPVAALYSDDACEFLDHADYELVEEGSTCASELFVVNGKAVQS